METINQALAKAKMRREYCSNRWQHTKRQEWKKELELIEYTIKFLREEINVKSRPLTETETASGVVRSDLLLRYRR